MDIEQLKEQRLFRELNPEQQKWLLAYIDSGRNLITASYAVYESKNANAARATGARALRHPKISQLITLYYTDDNKPSKEQFLQMLWQRISGGDKDTNSLLKLYADLRGWKGGVGAGDGDAASTENVSDPVLDELFDKANL